MNRRVLVSVSLLCAAALAGCAGVDEPVPGAEEPAGAEPDAGAYPVTVDNCGTEITVTAPPERIVTVKSTTFELLLALGLQEHLVGQAFLDGPVPAELDEAAQRVPELAERAPSVEAVLSAEPDLIFAGWESTFTDDGLGSRESLEQLEITTYVAPAACQEPEYQPNPLTFDDIAAHITQAGELFGAPDAAAELVAAQQTDLEAVTPSSAGLSALWYSSGSDTPFVGGGIGAPQLLMDTVGLQNIAGDIDDSWASYSWEAAAAAEPDVIVLVDSDWNTAENKIEVLEGVPAMAALPAVTEGRYLILDFPATEAGIRSASAAADLSQQLAEVEATLP